MSPASVKVADLVYVTSDGTDVATVVELHSPASGSDDPKRGSTPTAYQYGAFAQMYGHFNEHLFGGALPNVMLTFSRKPKARGFFWPDRWSERGDEERWLAEIALNPDCLRDLDERTVASIVVHEAVHCWQHVTGKPGRRGYHNQEWGTKMEAVGLMPSATGEPGGARTGQRMTHYVVDGGPFDLALAQMPEHWMLPFTSGAERVKPKRSDPSKVKFDCPACGAAAWGKVGLRIECLDCAVQMMSATPASTREPVSGATVEASPP